MNWLSKNKHHFPPEYFPGKLFLSIEHTVTVILLFIAISDISQPALFSCCMLSNSISTDVIISDWTDLPWNICKMILNYYFLPLKHVSSQRFKLSSLVCTLAVCVVTVVFCMPCTVPDYLCGAPCIKGLILRNYISDIISPSEQTGNWKQQEWERTVAMT